LRNPFANGWLKSWGVSVRAILVGILY